MRRTASVLATLLVAAGCRGGARCCPPAAPAPAPSAAAPASAPAEVAPMPQTVVDAASGVSETVLDNGLRILVKPQPDNPMVTTMIWYAVGSRDEGVGETGLSHYLEHMLFKGTETLPPGAIDRLTQKNGGQNNASTRPDATEYHFTFPADRWEVALDIEADRMRNANCPQVEFDNEKTVVLNELYIGLDDPFNVLLETVESAAFPVARYHHPVIGWEEDVVSTTRERMLAYYRKHYHPERATLVVVGGVDRERAVARAAERFGRIPRGDTPRFEMKEPPARGETRLTLVQDTQVPRLVLAFRSTSILDPKEPHLDLVSSVLSGDKTARLDKALVDTGLAASVQAWSDTRRDDGIFTIVVQPSPGRTLDELEVATKEVLAGLVASGPTPEELALAKKKILASQVFSQASSMGYASRLGSLAVVGDWKYVLRYPAAIEAATADDCKAAAARVFDPSKAVVGRSLPKPGAAAGGGSADADDVGEDDAEARADKGVRRARRRDGGTAAPAGGAAATIDRALTLAPTRAVLENGLRVVVLHRSTAPVFHARLSVLDGRLREAAPGLDALTGACLEEGTTERSGEAVAAAIGAVGGELTVAPASVTVKTMSGDATVGLSLLAEVASKPAFAEDAVARRRDRQLVELAEELDTPRVVAQLRFQAAVYGEQHPVGRSALGTEASLAAITRDHVVAHHRAVWTPSNAVLTVVSDLDPADVLARVRAALAGWTGEAPPPLAVPELPPLAPARVDVALERAQTNLFVGHRGIVRTDPDFVALEVTDNVFGTGAGFTDRLSKAVRDKAGLAYSVYGNVTANAGSVPGTFRMYAGTKPADAPRALAMMKEQLALLLGEAPPTAEELEGAKAALRGGMIASCETSEGLLGLLLLCERFGLGFDYPRRYLAAVEAVTADEVVRVARKHLHPEALVEVVVGPTKAAAPAPAAK